MKKTRSQKDAAVTQESGTWAGQERVVQRYGLPIEMGDDVMR